MKIKMISHYEWSFWDENGNVVPQQYKFTALICTYESVMFESEIPNVPWKVCVVDEAHRLKNREAKLTKCLMSYNVKHYIIYKLKIIIIQKIIHIYLTHSSCLLLSFCLLFFFLLLLPLLSLAKKKKIESRFILTGTPIQNNTAELWTLLSFIQPSVFNSLDDFQEKFSDVKDKQQVERLRDVLRPFLLRFFFSSCNF